MPWNFLATFFWYRGTLVLVPHLVTDLLICGGALVLIDCGECCLCCHRALSVRDGGAELPVGGGEGWLALGDVSRAALEDCLALTVTEVNT